MKLLEERIQRDGIVREGKWTGIPGFQYQTVRFHELAGKTAGIYGCGAIGERFGQMCRSFGMCVLGTRRAKQSGEENGITYVTPDTLLAGSDVVSLHCPLTKDTKHLINERSIGTMKDGVVIVNTSRGALIESEALIEGIKKKKISVF